MKTASRTILQFAPALTSAALVVLIVNNSRYKYLLERLRAENAQLAERLDQAGKEPAGPTPHKKRP